MRRSLLVPMLLVCAAPSAAQIARTAPAFPPALSPFIGVTSFGDRQALGSRKASYRGSFTVGVRGYLPLTQRVGLLGTVSLSPLAKQRTDDPFGRSLHDRVTVMRADAALGWRFIPRAPVFFYAGGGILAAIRIFLDAQAPQVNSQDPTMAARFQNQIDGPLNTTARVPLAGFHKPL